MATVKEKIAYLRGLLEGSDFWGQDAQARAVWEKMLEIFDDVADHIDELEAGQEEVEEYLEAIDADLGELEEEIYGHRHDEDDDDDDDDDDDEETNFVEMECPNCKETVYFEEDFLYDDDVEVACPECGETIYTTGDGSAGGDAGDDDTGRRAASS
ncbi:MAG: hypothetical protein LOD91_06690 [Limnochordales bacterium]|nr:hypothetical protein [Limnochordales bacterium]